MWRGHPALPRRAPRGLADSRHPRRLDARTAPGAPCSRMLPDDQNESAPLKSSSSLHPAPPSRMESSESKAGASAPSQGKLRLSHLQKKILTLSWEQTVVSYATDAATLLSSRSLHLRRVFAPSDRGGAENTRTVEAAPAMTGPDVTATCHRFRGAESTFRRRSPFSLHLLSLPRPLLIYQTFTDSLLRTRC